ncbi:MAG: VOC family protein [Gammaproteobacteria bacterium]|nr:VOC family protein [Gammaproteobacteria bacterium]
MNTKLPIVDIDHVVVRANDVAATVSFYRDALGCEVERELDIGLVQLRAGRSLIDIVPVDSELGRKGGDPPSVTSPRRNMDHFCLRLNPFDETAIRAHLDKHGVTAGPVSRRYGADGFGASIYLTDPEGNTVELKGPPESDPQLLP